MIDNNQLHTMPEQKIKRPPMTQTPIQQNVDRQIQDLGSTKKNPNHVF